MKTLPTIHKRKKKPNKTNKKTPATVSSIKILWYMNLWNSKRECIVHASNSLHSTGQCIFLLFVQRCVTGNLNYLRAHLQLHCPQAEEITFFN